MSTFRAMVIDQVDGKPKAGFRDLTLADLPDNDVLVKVEYSTLNYKGRPVDHGQGPHRPQVPHGRGCRSRRHRR